MQKKLTLNEDFKECSSFVSDIENLFKSSSNSIHKARNEIKIIECKQHSVVVKSFKTPNFLNSYVYTYFRKSKAYKSYHNALTLMGMGINTPTPIALVENFDSRLTSSYYVSKEFRYDFTIREPLLDKNFDNRERIFKEFAHFCVLLHRNGVYHEDFSPGNILIRKVDYHFEFSIVDINRMSFGEISFERGCENFNRLWADEDVLEIIAKQYSKEMNYNGKKTLENILAFDKKHKDFKLLKRKIKAWF